MQHVNKDEKMSLYRYFRPADGVLDSQGPLSLYRVKLVAASQTRKWGSYLFLTPEEKARVTKYGNVNGVQAAIRRFSNEFCKDLKENTVRDWVKLYNTELKKKRGSSGEPGCDVVLNELSGTKCGKPFLLGVTVDAEVQAILKAMCDSGAVVNTSIAIATAMCLVCKRNRSLLKEEGGPLKLTKNWAKSILYRMGKPFSTGNCNRSSE